MVFANALRCGRAAPQSVRGPSMRLASPPPFTWRQLLATRLVIPTLYLVLAVGYWADYSSPLPGARGPGFPIKIRALKGIPKAEKSEKKAFFGRGKLLPAAGYPGRRCRSGPAEVAPGNSFSWPRQRRLVLRCFR